jgi:F0F1-type ATP synthase membrane subunit c/vacuolar-type H+-ATPase subunit K
MSKKVQWMLGALLFLLFVAIPSPVLAGTKGAAASSAAPLIARIVLGLGLSLGLSGSAMGLSVSFSAMLGGGTENFYKYIACGLMPATQGIYSMVIFFTSISLLDTNPYLAAGKGAIMGFVMGLSAWYQGIVCAAGIRNCLEGRNTLANAMISGAMPETYAVFGLVMTFIMK